MPVVRLGDVDVYYELHGTGRDLLLINGFGSSVEMWSPFWHRFTTSHRVLLFDNRGVGRSTVPEVPFTIRDMADDAARLLDALGIDSTSVYGASMGGMIAQELALNHPEKVRALILGMTTCGGSRSVPMAANQMEQTSRPGTDPREMIERRLRLTYSPGYLEAHRGELIQAALSVRYPTTPPGYRLQGLAALKFDSYDRLPQLNVPTLVLAGSADAIIPPENARILASRIPGARLRIFEGAGHAFTREREDEAVETMTEFLRSAEAAGRDSLMPAPR